MIPGRRDGPEPDGQLGEDGRYVDVMGAERSLSHLRVRVGRCSYTPKGLVITSSRSDSRDRSRATTIPMTNPQEMGHINDRAEINGEINEVADVLQRPGIDRSCRWYRWDVG